MASRNRLAGRVLVAVFAVWTVAAIVLCLVFLLSEQRGHPPWGIFAVPVAVVWLLGCFALLLARSRLIVR